MKTILLYDLIVSAENISGLTVHGHNRIFQQKHLKQTEFSIERHHHLAGKALLGSSEQRENIFGLLNRSKD
jgi:hypothetical protein